MDVAAGAFPGQEGALALQWATAVAVFFLPKHWTDCVEAIFAFEVSRVVFAMKSNFDFPRKH